MKKIILILIFILFSFSIISKTLKIQLKKNLQIPTDQQATGVIIESNKKTTIENYKNNSLNGLSMSGNIKYKKMSNGKYKVFISWNKAGSRYLSTPLKSRFTVKSNKINQGTSFKMKGSTKELETLVSKNGLNKINLGTNSKTNNKDQNRRVSSNSSPPKRLLSSQNSTSQGSSASDSNSETDYGASTVEQIPCQPIREDQVIYEAMKLITKNGKGEQINSTECKKTGQAIPIDKDYSSCPRFLDIESRKAYFKYMEFAKVGGSKLPLSNCITDQSRFFEIQETYQECNLRHDFIQETVFQQTKLYYREEADIVDVTDCRDSKHENLQFKMEKTQQGCPLIENEDNTIIEQQKIFYKDSNGAVEYITECQPIASEGSTMQEVVCEEDKYFHNYPLYQTFYNTRYEYIDHEGNTKVFRKCAPSISGKYPIFPHKDDIDSCSSKNDDTLLVSILMTRRYVETTEDGTIHFGDCEDRFNRVPYSYSGIEEYRIGNVTGTRGYDTCIYENYKKRHKYIRGDGTIYFKDSNLPNRRGIQLSCSCSGSGC